MRRLQRASLLLSVLLFAGYACDLSSLDLTGQNPMATSLAQTLSVILTASPPAVTSTLAAATATGAIATTPGEGPSSTPIPSLSPTVTLTPTWTPTAETIYTPTPIVPSISVSVPTNCREGPGQPYNIVGALLVVAARALGRIAGVTQPDELHAFDDAPELHVQARNDPLREHVADDSSAWEP